MFNVNSQNMLPIFSHYSNEVGDDLIGHIYIHACIHAYVYVCIYSKIFCRVVRFLLAIRAFLTDVIL